MPRKPSYDKQELIVLAKELFWKKGWAGTSMKDLETMLNMRPGSFYAAFGSKDALYELALEQYAQEGLARLENMRKKLGAYETLKRFPSEVVSGKNLPIRACMLSKTLLELQDQENTLSNKANFHLCAMENKFAALFKEAQKNGTIRGDIKAEKLARRYQSDLMGLRITAERKDVDTKMLAKEISNDIVATLAVK